MSNLQLPRPLCTKTARRLQGPRTFFGEGRTRSAFAKVNGGSDAIIEFGRYRVLPRTRQLLVDGQPKELGSRAFDLLMVLASAPGTVVKKGEILGRVWPDTIVGEANLKVQMSALRKALSEDRGIIKTIHGRGYVFTGEVTQGPLSRNPGVALANCSEARMRQVHSSRDPRRAQRLGRHWP